MVAGWAALVMGALAASGVWPTPEIALGAALVGAVLAAAAVMLHQARQEARWNAGHRLR